MADSKPIKYESEREQIRHMMEQLNLGIEEVTNNTGV